MLYLENKLSGEEVRKFNSFTRQLGSSINALCDTMATAHFKEFSLNVFKLDDLVGKNVPEYDPLSCKYKGCEVSCADVIRLVYGEEIEGILQKLVKTE